MTAELPRQRATLTAIRTVCHHCDGQGTVGRWCAAAFDGLALAGGCQLDPCPQCFGSEWLPGVLPPC